MPSTNTSTEDTDTSRGAFGLRGLLQVRPAERKPAVLLFLVFFGIITHFWILKPLKKALFIQAYDEQGLVLGAVVLTAAQAELLAKVANMGVALVAVAAFSLLSRRLRRARLLGALGLIFLAVELAFAATARSPGPAWVWSFYLFGDLWTTWMVAAFFAFLHDSVSPEAARRLYGPIGLGGVLGGVFGTSALALWLDDLSVRAWLGIGALGIVAIVACAIGAERGLPRRRVEPAPTERENRTPAGRGRASALAGARLTWRSGYLLSIAAIVGLYEIASTLMDFQFTSAVAHHLDGPEIGEHFARVFTLTNLVSLGVQGGLTSLVMTRFGVGVALAILPVAMFSGSAFFLAVPALWPGSLLNTADNGFAYSIQQSSKEALYVPTSRAEKYEAKAFIDMFVQRAAKAAAVGVSLGVTAWFSDYSTLRWLSLLTIALIGLWAYAVRHVAREYSELTEGGEPVAPPAEAAPTPTPTPAGA